MHQNTSKTAAPAQKVAEAIRAHVERHGTRPAEVLVNPADFAALVAEPEVDGIPVRPRSYVGKDLFYVGFPDPPVEVGTR
jgi:hypothetical protein